MRKFAKDAGVSVYAPREFYAGKLDESAEIERFLRKFREKAPNYIAAHWQKRGPDQIAGVFEWVYGYYRMILLGEAEGRDEAVRVSVF
jgi:hypothetical protein